MSTILDNINDTIEETPTNKLTECESIFKLCINNWYSDQNKSYDNCIILYKKCKNNLKNFKDN